MNLPWSHSRQQRQRHHSGTATWAPYCQFSYQKGGLVLHYLKWWVGGTEICRALPLWVRLIFHVIWALGYVCAFFLSNPLIRTASKNGGDFIWVCFDRKAFGEFLKAKYVYGSELLDTPEKSKNEKQQKDLWRGSLELAVSKKGDTILKDWAWTYLELSVREILGRYCGAFFPAVIMFKEQQWNKVLSWFFLAASASRNKTTHMVTPKERRLQAANFSARLCCFAWGLFRRTGCSNAVDQSFAIELGGQGRNSKNQRLSKINRQSQEGKWTVLWK